VKWGRFNSIKKMLSDDKKNRVIMGRNERYFNSDKKGENIALKWYSSTERMAEERMQEKTNVLHWTVQGKEKEWKTFRHVYEQF
jgi:ASC-1-like (ASCH) protein